MVEAQTLQELLGGVRLGRLDRELVLPIAKQYKQVGTIIRADQNMCADIVAKMSVIRVTTHKLKKRCSGIRTSVWRCGHRFWNTHVLPSGEYACGT